MWLVTVKLGLPLVSAILVILAVNLVHTQDTDSVNVCKCNQNYLNFEQGTTETQLSKIL